MKAILEQELSKVYEDLMKSSQQVTTTTPEGQPSVATPVDPTAPVASVPNVEPATTAQPVSTTAAPVVDFNAIVEDWDSVSVASAPAALPSTAIPATPPVSFDFSEIAKVLNIGEIKDKEGLVKVAQELKQKADSIGALPADLAKAVEIAGLGGNYLEYLNVSTVDWSKEDPIVLYENYIVDRFTDANGMVDNDKIDKLLDKMDEDEKELRGLELRNQYILIQNQQKSNIEAQARQAKSQFENSLRSAIDSVDNVAGFKLSAANKAELFKEVFSGEDLKHNDLRSRVEAAAIRKYWGKMDEYRKTQIKNATLRQTLEEATFPKLGTSSSPAAPETQSGKYNVQDYINELAGRRGFAKQ